MESNILNGYVHVPKIYYKIKGNEILYSFYPKDGYNIHPLFVDINGIVLDEAKIEIPMNIDLSILTKMK